MKNIWKMFFVLASLQFSAQQENYYEKWYNADESKLPQNTIKSIVKDKYGFIWLSTENGIVRFDGKNFLTYDVNIPSVENRTLMIDGTADDDWLFTFYNSGEIPSLITRRGFSVISKKNAAVFQQLKAHGRENLLKILKVSSEKTKNERFYFYITKKEFYDLDHGRLFYQKNGKRRFIRDLNGYVFFCFFLLGDQLFYLKDSAVIEKIERTGAIKKYPTGITKKADDFNFFINTANKQLLLKNDNKIYIIEYRNNSIAAIPVCSSKTLKGLSPSCMYYDHVTKMLILGTVSQGFLMVRKNFIKAYDTPRQTIFNAVTQYDEKEVITGDGNIFSSKGYIKSLPFPNKDPYGILPLKNKGEFVLKSEHSIMLWSQNKSRILRHFGKESVVCGISSTPGDTIWISLISGGKNLLGYIILNNRKIVKERFYQINIPVRGIARLNNEELLLAAHNGLYLFNKKKRTRKTIITGITFRSINNNRDDLFWIHTYGKGLYLYKDGKLYGPPQKSDVLSSVHSVIDDGMGLLAFFK